MVAALAIIAAVAALIMIVLALHASLSIQRYQRHVEYCTESLLDENAIRAILADHLEVPPDRIMLPNVVWVRILKPGLTP